MSLSVAAAVNNLQEQEKQEQQLRANDESTTAGRIDPLEEHAVFLSEFQSHYSFYKFGKIHTEEIAQVFEYRSLCDKLDELKEDEALLFRRLNNECSSSKTMNNPYETDIVSCQNEINRLESNDRLLHLDMLVERFQVWSTKALVQHLLLGHDHERNLDSDAECWSMLLNLPSASYMSGRLIPSTAKTDAKLQNVKENKPMTPFANIWNDIYNSQNHQCSLILPPNVYNFKEYARLTHMIAQLPTPAAARACRRSPFCRKPTRSTCAPKFFLRPYDLVALWTHAQRNGGALRQLMQMFVLERNDSDEHVNYNDKHRNMTTFRATFAGNHRLSHRKAVQESHLIDRIAAYAVLNQASMTRPKIMEAYQYQMQHQTQPDIWRTSLHRPAKRMRYPLNANEASLCGDDRVELLRACQLHLLYGLVDSHRRAVQSAIYAKRSQLINVLKCTRRDKAEVTEAEGLMMRLRRRRGELWSNPTLMHIARRLERGVCKEEVCDRLRKTADGEQVSDSIDAAVRQLLDMILKCAMHGEARDSGIERKDNIYQQAIDHWKAGYKTFTKKRDRYGLVAAARQLLSENDENAPEPASIAMCLRARPSPWFDKCVAVSCSSPISPELHDSEFLICANCNKAVHKKCGDKEEWCSAESRVRRQSLPEWKLILPTDAAMPDFREERAQVLRWSMKPIKLKRSVIDDSLELEPLGITFQDLEVCSQLLQDASLGNCLVTDLARVAVTYAADMKGLLVTEVVGGGVSERHGVRLGDVIVSVKVVDEDDSTNSVTKTNMEHMSLLERQESVLVDATDLEIIIRRPDAAVLEGLQKWRMGLEEANRYSLSEWRLIEQSYYCQICKDKVEEPEADVALPERVFRIARAMRSYDNCASLVGSSVFILPDDPFFDAIQRELRKVNISFDHLNRPVELLILAFVPSSIDVEAHDRDAPSGTFFLLPIVSYEQLKLLGPLCKPRQIFAGTLDAQTLKSWTKDELLDLTGVMKLPFEDVHQMLAQTELMHDAVAVRVATLASCTCRDALEPHDDHESDRSRPHFPCTCNLADFGVPRYTPTLRGSFHILDDMFSSRAPHLMRLLHKTEEPIDMDGIANLDEELPYITPHPVKGIAGACNTQCSTIHPHSDCRIFFSDIQAESGSLVDAGDPRCDSVRKLEKKFVVLHLNSVLCNASWGFEIVQWRNDSNRLRVGRLKEQSPAYQQGVPANAILLAINGLDIQSLVRDAHALSSAMRGVAATASTGSVASERRIVLHIQEPVQPTEDSVITASLSKKFAVPIEGSLSGTSANDNGLKAGATLATINETLARPDSDKRLVHASLCQATDQSAPFSQSPELEVNIIYPKNIYAGQLERLYTDLWSIAEGEHLNPPHDRYLMHCSDPRTESLTYGPDCDMTIKKSKNSQLLCGYGWGLEIVKWESDTDAECRIGRINTESDAFKAGLRPNDVVLAVNCKPIDKFQNNGELAAAVLRIPYSASWSQSSDVMSSIVRKEVSHPSATILILKVRQPSHLPLPGPVNAHKPIAWIEPINPHAIDAAAASKTTGRIIDLTADDDIHKNMDGVCFPFLTAVARCKNVHDDLIKEATLLQKRVVFRDARSICLDDLTLAPWDSNVSFSTTEVAVLYNFCRDGRIAQAAELLSPRHSMDLILRYVQYLLVLPDERLNRIPSLSIDLMSFLHERNVTRKNFFGEKMNDFASATNPIHLHTAVRYYLEYTTCLRIRGGGSHDSEVSSIPELRGGDSYDSPAPAAVSTTTPPLLIYASPPELDRAPTDANDGMETGATHSPPFEGPLKRNLRHSDGYNCRSCDFGTERVLLVDAEGALDVENGQYYGTGCAMSMSEICFDYSDDSLDDACVSGHIVKKALLHLADRTSPSCKFLVTGSSAPDLNLRERMWRNFNDWKNFVVESRELGSLCQAFVILLSSVKLDRMPRWYKDNGGWSSPLVLMQLRSMSALLLHIQVFDVALAEYDYSELTQSFVAPTKPLLPTAPEYAVLAAEVVTIGKDLGWRPETEHSFYCIECEDGGDVVCCEFCPTICHAECFRPMLEDEPKHFVCRSCMTDLQKYKETLSANDVSEDLLLLKMGEDDQVWRRKTLVDSLL